MFSGHFKSLWPAVGGMLFLAGACFGQETTGTVRGSVSDPTRAAVPGASVELSGGVIPRPFVTSTDATGYYSFTQVPPGTGYTLSVTEPGFRTAKLSDVNVQLGKATVVDIKLEVGQISDAVIISAEPTLVDTKVSASAIIARQILLRPYSQRTRLFRRHPRCSRRA